MSDPRPPQVRPVTALIRRILQLTERADFAMADALGLSRGDFNAMAHFMCVCVCFLCVCVRVLAGI